MAHRLDLEHQKDYEGLQSLQSPVSRLQVIATSFFYVTESSLGFSTFYSPSFPDAVFLRYAGQARWSVVLECPTGLSRTNLCSCV